jgi:hypothetical protein
MDTIYLSAIETMHTLNDISGQSELPHKEAYGLWKGHSLYLHGESERLPEDGLLYQGRMREEWDEQSNE